MAANGAGPHLLVDDLTADRSSRMISKMIWVTVSDYVQPRPVVIPTPFTCLGVNTLKLNASLKSKFILFVSFLIHWAVFSTNNIRIVLMFKYLWT